MVPSETWITVSESMLDAELVSEISSSGRAKDTVAVEGVGDLNGDLQQLCKEFAEVEGDGSGIDKVAFRFGDKVSF